MKRFKKKSTLFFTVLALCCTVFFGTALQTQIVQASDLPDPTKSISVEYVNVGTKSVTLSTPGKMYILYGSTTKNTVTIKGGTEQTPIYVSLNGVNMDLSKEKKSPLIFENNSFSQCWIAYDNGALPSYAREKANTLYAGSSHAGLNVSTNATFVMRSQKGVTAALSCAGGSNGAGIGGNSETSIRKKLEISVAETVTVTASGGNNAAGIGGGASGSFSNISIESGTVTAHSAGGSAGIGVGGGGSSLNDGGSIYIKGGNVQTDSLVVGTSYENTARNKPGKAYISGGTVKIGWSPDNMDDCPYYYIDGGSVNVADSAPARQATNLAGQSVYRVTMKVPDPAYSKVSNLTILNNRKFIPYGTTGMQTDAASMLYLYVTPSNTNVLTADLQVGASQYPGYFGTASADNHGKLKLPFVTTLTADPNLYSLIGGSGGTCTVTITSPLVENIASVKFLSSNPDIASVDEATGVVTPHDLGSFTITAQAVPVDTEMYNVGGGTITGNISNIAGNISIVEDISKEYDAESVTDPAVSTNGRGAVTYEYSDDGGVTYTPTKPTDAGSYQVRANIAADERFTAASDVKDFVITQRETAMTVSATQVDTQQTKVSVTIFNLEKNSYVNEKNVKLTLDGGLSYQNPDSSAYDGNNGVCVQTYTYSGLLPGEYTIAASYDPGADANYLPCSAEFIYDTSKANAPIEAIDMRDLIYGKNDSFSLKITGVLHNRELSVKVIEEFGFFAESTVDSAGGLDFTVNNAGKVKIVVIAKADDTYNGAVAYANVTVKRKALTVTPILADAIPPASPADAQLISSRAYGDPNPAFDIYYDGLAEGDTSENVSSAFTILGQPCKGTLNPNAFASQTSDVGTYDISIQKQGIFVSRNYDIAYQTAKIEVTPAPAKVIAENKTSIYGQALCSLTYSFEGLKNGDSEENFGKPDIVTTTVDTSDAGEYPITLDINGLTTTNYDFTKQDALYTIEKAFANIQIDCEGKIYDKTPVKPQVLINTGAQKVNYIYRSIESDEVLTYEEFSKLPPTDAGAYAVVAYAAPTTNYAEGHSAPLPFSIQKAYPFEEIEQSLPQVGTVNYVNGQTLNTIPLPERWQWYSPQKELKPGVGKSYAVYTPQDTRNYTLGGAVVSYSAVNQSKVVDPENTPKDDGQKRAPLTGDSSITLLLMIGMFVEINLILHALFINWTTRK